MPFRDLRTGDNEIDSLGPFIVLAVMCFPQASERAERGRMVSTLRRHTGVGKVRRGVLSNEAFLDAVARHTARGGACGSLLLTYLQLSTLGKRASLNQAIEIVSALPARWTDHLWPVWDAKSVDRHMPHSRGKLLRAFSSYLPAAHLWAALLYGHQNARADITPARPNTLPTFLAYADEFLVMADRTPWAGRDRRSLLPGAMAWRFGLPARFKQSVYLQSLPDLPHP
jgi:hypothetical protein